MTALRGRRVLLGVTGGIAAYKAASLARELQRAGAEVTAVLTASATRFIGADTFAGLTGHPAYTSLWESPGEVVHVRLAHAHELAVIEVQLLISRATIIAAAFHTDDRHSIFRRPVAETVVFVLCDNARFNKHRQRYGCQITHSYFVWRSVLDDLRAKVRRLDTS